MLRDPMKVTPTSPALQLLRVFNISRYVHAMSGNINLELVHIVVRVRTEGITSFMCRRRLEENSNRNGNSFLG